MVFIYDSLKLTNPHSTKYLFVIYLGISGLLVLLSYYYLFKKIKAEIAGTAVDMFKVMQYTTGIILLTGSCVGDSMPFFSTRNSFWAYLYLAKTGLYVCIFFETINVTGWINVILHISHYMDKNKGPDEMRSILKDIKRKERLIIMIPLTLLVVILIDFSISLGMLGYKKGKNILDEHGNENNYFDRNFYNATLRITRCAYLNGVSLFIFGFLAIFCIFGKFISCYLMLQKVEKILHGYYIKVYKWLIFSSVLTGAYLLLKMIGVLWSAKDIIDIKMAVLYDRHDNKVHDWEPWVAFFVSLIDSALELFSMIISIENIDFKGYLYRLMRGRNIDDSFFKASYYIKRPGIKAKEQEEQEEEKSETFISNNRPSEIDNTEMLIEVNDTEYLEIRPDD